MNILKNNLVLIAIIIVAFILYRNYTNSKAVQKKGLNSRAKYIQDILAEKANMARNGRFRVVHKALTPAIEDEKVSDTLMAEFTE